MFGCGGRSSYRRMSYRRFSLSLTGRFLDFDEFGLRGKFLDLPGGWTIFMPLTGLDSYQSLVGGKFPQ